MLRPPFDYILSYDPLLQLTIYPDPLLPFTLIFFDAGGTPAALRQAPPDVTAWQQLPLLHNLVLMNAHPHRELVESVQLLLDAGADINVSYAGDDGVGCTAMMCAAQRKCCAGVLDVLLQAGADPCARSSPQGMTALHEAAQNGPAESCALLLERADALLEAKDIKGWTALMHASACGQLDSVKVPLQHGADVNTVSCEGVSALIAASRKNHRDVVICLLGAGAHVNAVDHQGTSALDSALQYNYLPIVRLLLEHGADVQLKDDTAQTVLFETVGLGNVSLLDKLVHSGFSVQTADKGYTLLMLAVFMRHKAVAEWLLQHGVNVDATVD
jgi:uncharacterized protein